MIQQLQHTILIISADGYQSRFMSDCLESAGYLVLATDPGNDVLALISKEKPSLVLLDWKLPDRSSLAMLGALRAGRQTARLPVILMGGEMKEDDRLAALEAGADLCLTETLRPKVLTAVVRSVLRRTRESEG